MVLSRATRVRAAAASAALATLGAGLTAGGFAAPAAAADLPAPLVRYEFDPDDLTTGVVTDSSGNGLNATLVNGASATLVEGADGGSAVDLPGGAPTSTGAYIQLPRQILAGATDLTVSTRIRWDGTPASWQWIYALGTNTTRYLFSTPYNGDGRLRTAVTTGGGGAEAQVTGTAALPANTWKTLTVTLDTAADRITTYLDGVAVGSAPTTIGAGDLLTASATSAGFIGRSFYQDPLFAGAVDDFRVYRAALTPEQVAEDFGGTLPTPTGIAQTSFDVRTSIGTAPSLPATVPATFSDGYARALPVTWDAVDPEDYAQRGSFTVGGIAGGWAVTATVTVVREGELVIDLAEDTGPFHGGASGTLYGLYGQDVPTNNLIEGMKLRTVSTKAQDGPQHPGADALEVVKPLADSTDGDVYIYMTDIHRGFPYEWPGATPEQKLDLYIEKIEKQVDQVLQLPEAYQDNIVFVPFNEPEGNMFGTGQWSYNRVSWRTDPTHYFAAWDEIYRLIKGRMPDARIAGPNTSVLYNEVIGFMEHTIEAGTVPDVVTWHELSHPEQVRTSVARYRQWEREFFAGTPYEGTELPINVNEYAFNYHTSVPGQMIQWISAIEESKVDADIAYWNIDGNLSDSAVQANRGNGQWWLFNAYASMTGHTVEVRPPFPGRNYTLQGVATLDEEKSQARALFGGAAGNGFIEFQNVPDDLGDAVHAWIREIPWTGQIGDSAQPKIVDERVVEVTDDGTVAFDFGGDLPKLRESSAYEIVLAPAGDGEPTAVPPTVWEQTYEAEDAAHTGSGYSRNGPEGSPSDVSKFYTSGGYNVGGLRTGSNVTLDFTVDVPQDGVYDLSVFANSLNTYGLVQEQGPTNVFLRVDGAAEQELFLPLGYKWVVWDHTDTTVELTAGTHTITLAARSIDGTGATEGDAIVDRIHLSLANPEATSDTYEAELAELDGARTVYDDPRLERRGASGSGAAEVRPGDTATFWVYSADDAEATLRLRALGGGVADLAVNGRDVLRVGPTTSAVAASLSGGINKITVTGITGAALVDRLEVVQATGMLAEQVYEAEDATTAGTAAAADFSLASGGAAVTGIGGEPGNGNTLTFEVTAPAAGTYAMRVRYSNPEQSVASHYNPDPLARRADLTVNGSDAGSVSFPHSFHQNNFWELTIPVELRKGQNTVTFASEEMPNFDGVTYASDTWPGILLRSQYAPVIDKITVAPFSGPRLR
ncbi:carbohydrate-binding protein [Jiangella aurantiaca]|uniref:Carbohydrate-binding protein n=1 Tax=Jiangella aurantiaca TaxID=2530373 RepID=A0A4R5ALU7_9ACTN|nr:LamG-like jellyroll fold domain-containing protein [Jiangella aurantiaca]TDD72620.1 carbohydrate-binding protein [Jiangella aurantiaca]